MRVIAGRAGGVRLLVPKAGVRPTMDRVKAAIFSSLGDAVIGARVLDLFAGSGGLGIEALSRGAKSALFVEENRQAIAAIESNLKKTKLAGEIRHQDVFDFLKRVNLATPFDIIFADPPYEQTKSGERFTDHLLATERLPQSLETGGIFVLEKRPEEKFPETKFWELIRSRKYGATEVLFLEKSEVRSPKSENSEIDPADLQFALADRSAAFFAGISGENVSSRRLSRKFWPAFRTVRPPALRTILLEEIDLAARGERG